MSTSAENLARELADFRRRLAALERGTQLTTSTIGLSGGTVSIMQGLEAGVAAGAAAAEAIAKAASAEAKADGAVHTYFGPTAPGQGVQIGDLWRDDDGIVHQFDGTDWVPISADADLSEALDRIAHTEEALDGKISTYFVPSRNAPPEDILVEGDLWIVTDGGNLIRRWSGTEWVDIPAGAGALADRAVTSTKLETDLVLSSRIIAGSLNGSRAEMNPDGFYVCDGDRELMRLGVAGASDYMTIMKDDGTSVAGITQAGTVNALGVSAGNKLWYKGRELTEILDELPLGILAVGKRTTRGPVLAPSNGWVQYMRIDATIWPGRHYRLSLGPVAAGIASGGVLGIQIRYSYDNVCTPTSGTQIAYQRISADRDTRGLISVPFEVEGTDGTARSVSFLVCYANVASGGQVNLTPDQSGEAQPTYFTLEDMGVTYRTVSKGDAGAINVPPDSVPGPVAPGTLDVYPTERRNYVVDNLGNATAYTVPGATADMLYQGPWPSHGRRYVSVVNFNGAIQPLSYGTPAGMLLLLNATQWYYANGGTVTLAPHGWTTLPNSFKLSDLPTFRVESASFPNPGYRYIPIPSSLWNHFKTGQYRGFVLIGDDTLDSSGVFANHPEVNADLQLPILQVGVIPTYSGGPA